MCEAGDIVIKSTLSGLVRHGSFCGQATIHCACTHAFYVFGGGYTYQIPWIIDPFGLIKLL